MNKDLKYLALKIDDALDRYNLPALREVLAEINTIDIDQEDISKLDRRDKPQ
ncbi:MAG TPA: hypothetical protein VKY57_07715 [Chitinispirillaceae bacterium]|nr:hypothetical protein [Fibrobacter sp.]HLV31438.1 hypothetical protein [Chitinispirillaceae bacterium]